MPTGIYIRKPFSKRRKKNMSMARKGKKNPNWKGNKTKKLGLHKWLRENKKKSKFCKFCNKKRVLDLANIKHHKYSRNLDDYEWICRSCHIRYDRGTFGETEEEKKNRMESYRIKWRKINGR